MFPTGTSYVLTYYRVSALYSQLYGGSNSILYGLPVPVFYRSLPVLVFYQHVSVFSDSGTVPVYYRYCIGALTCLPICRKGYR